MKDGIISYLKDYERRKTLWLCVLGSLIFSISVNMFVEPAQLYSGGFTGIAQIIARYVAFPMKGVNAIGVYYFLMNVPLFIICYKQLGKSFIVRTFICSVMESVFLAIIPIPEQPLVNDTLTACLLGGVLGGIGSAIMFVNHGSGGGTDLVGMLVAKYNKNIGVGTVSIMFNMFVYIFCALTMSVNLAIYSFLMEIILSTTIDRLHKQNKTVCANVITGKPKEVSDFIMNEFNRGATIVNATGAYTNSDAYMVIAVISEYEMEKLNKDVEKLDKNAFIFIQENVIVNGDFQKHL